jgi:hypothetical protein
MRALLLTVTAAIGVLSAGTALAVDECPLALSLKTPPDAFVAKLAAMPSVHSDRRPERKPFLGKCTYQASSFMQFAMSSNGMCSIEGQPVVGSAVEILDSESTVVSHTFMVIQSDESLAAVRSALSKVAAPVTPQADPGAWKPEHYTVIDDVYAHGDDMWTVSHKPSDPGAVKTAPDVYMVTHVRRDWLDFARRDLNACAEVPAKKS